MTVWALYSEIDPFAAAWLTKLIGAGHIMPGVVDTRSLEDLTPDECNEFRQVHLCAGIGVWSHALRMAGWEDHRPCWTASFPCQPFSAAGKGAAFADERHIWPSGHWLIDQCRPPIVFGEQVASKDGLAWLDVVSADLEGSGYAFGAADLCAAGVGAPHIRQRSYWVADANGKSRRARLCDSEQAEHRRTTAARRGSDGGLGDGDGDGFGQGRGGVSATGRDRAERDGPAIGLEDPKCEGLERCDGSGSMELHGGSGSIRSATASSIPLRSTGPTNGFWSDADWLYCRDGRWRPVEPGTFPLVARPAEGMVRGSNSSRPINANSSAEGRVGRLRGYGNALCSPVAETFIASVIECVTGAE